MNTIQYSSPPTNLNVNLNNNNSWTKKKVVHLVGGFSALVVTIYLGPRYCHQQSIIRPLLVQCFRTGQQHSTETVVMGNPTFCLAGLFITW